jgi:hypothetical protein
MIYYDLCTVVIYGSRQDGNIVSLKSSPIQPTWIITNAAMNKYSLKIIGVFLSYVFVSKQ